LDLTQSPAGVQLMGRVDSRQITQVARAANGDTVVAGSNPGRLLALRSGAGGTGTFESEVRDAGSAARWGSIRWRAAGAAAVSTRTGNTSRPDDTWSEWSAPYTVADGSPIVSPSARYLQWRAVLSAGAGPAPELTSVTVAYLPRNLRPAVASITVLPPGAVFQRPFTSSDAEIAGFDAAGGNADAEGQAPDAAAQAVGRRMYRKGLQTFQWRADDPNGDRLTYAVAYRREGESAWRPLRAGLLDPIFVWDTTSVADGRYSVRVIASDAPTNSPGDALDGARDSDGFDIDNSAPVITVLPASGDGRTVRLTVRDAQSGVQRVEYALGGESWQVVYPADGLSDSRDETFTITLPSAADRARLVVRATDVLQNVSTRGDVR
nr:hypothetical protein [Acidobacteriota bacterium]